MHTGILHMLRYSANKEPAAMRDCVHVDLLSAIDELGHDDRMQRGD
jgi:hypothetical protein